MRGSLATIGRSLAAARGRVRELRLGGGEDRLTAGGDGTSLARARCPAGER